MSKYPILFDASESEFKTNGIGVLSDAVQCYVIEELNGIFELNMVYPQSGRYIKEIQNECIIYADASIELGFQPFRICRITKLLNGLINVYARHISYDLCGVQLPPFETLGSQDGMEKVKQYSTIENEYYFSTTMQSNITFSTKEPRSVRSYLLNPKDSFLSTYGGEFTFDKHLVRHHSARGSDKGFRVKYGVNLIDLNQEENIEEMYTGIYPYYKNGDIFMDLTGTYNLSKSYEIDDETLSQKIIYAGGNFQKQKIKSVDLSDQFKDQDSDPTSDQLLSAARTYMSDQKIGVPSVSIEIQFENLSRFLEYKDIPASYDVFLGDTVSVLFVKIGISAKARTNRIEYDSLLHKIKSITVGDVKKGISDTIITAFNKMVSYEDLLGAYATLQDLGKVEVKIPTYTSQLQNDSTFATEKFVTDKITEAQLGGDDAEIDLSGFATKEDLQNVENKIPDEAGLATKEEVQAVEKKVDDLEIASKNQFATKEDLESVDDKVDNIKIPDTSSFATKEELQNVENKIPDKEELVTKEELNEVEEKIPDANDLIDENTVKELIDEALIAAGVTPDGYYQGEVIYKGEGEERRAYFKVNSRFLARNGYAMIDDLGVTAEKQNAEDEGARFPLILSTTTDILEVVIVTMYDSVLSVDTGIIVRSGDSWSWTPNDWQPVSTLTITSNSPYTEIVQLMVITK